MTVVIMNLFRGHKKCYFTILPTLIFEQFRQAYLQKEGKSGFVITSKIMQALYAGIARKSLITNNTIRFLKDFSSSGTNDEAFIEVIDPNNQHINWKVYRMSFP